MKTKEELKECLVIEQKELKEKLIKLVEFINSEEFFTLSNNYKKILQNQKVIMELYLNILNIRTYQDTDNIIVPDITLLGIISSMFTFDNCLYSEELKKLNAMMEEDIRKCSIS